MNVKLTLFPQDPSRGENDILDMDDSDPFDTVRGFELFHTLSGQWRKTEPIMDLDKCYIKFCSSS